MDEDDPFDGLDWRAHLLPPARQPAGDGIFLPVAARLLAGRLIEGWTGHMAQDISREVPSFDLPSIVDAFDGEGLAVMTVHDEHGARMRSLVPDDEWQSLLLASKVASVEAGAPPHDTDRRPGPLADMEPAALEMERWNLAFLRSTDARQLRETARGHAEAVLAGLVAMTADESIRLNATSMSSRTSRRLGPDAWWGTFRQRLELLATARVHVAEKDELLFVDEEDLEQAFNRYAERNEVRLFPAGHPLHGIRLAHEVADGCVTRHPQLEMLVADVIREELAKPEHDNWRGRDLVKLVKSLAPPSTSPATAEEVALSLRDHWSGDPKLEFLSRRGQPRPEGRPALMGQKDYGALVVRLTHAMASRRS